MHRGGVGLGAGMRLYVCVFGSEEGDQPFDRERFDRVDVLASAVVPAARVALGVLVGQHRALCLQHGPRCVVLRRDHLEAALLANQLEVDQACDLGVEVTK